jgi:Flp pilus assembly protein TadD
LLGSGKKAEAERAFQSALQIDPHYAEAESNLGVLYGQAGRISDAKALFRAAIEDNPRHAQAYLNLGLMLAAEGSFPEAAAELKKAIELCGNCGARADILNALQKIVPAQ